MAAEPIRKITTGRDGKVRDRLVVDAGSHPDGRRRQVTRTYDTLREARAELSRVRHQRGEGSYVQPSKVTFATLAENWLAGQRAGIEQNTWNAYESLLRVPLEVLGGLRVQAITRADVARVVDIMAGPGGREAASQAGRGLSGRTIGSSLSLLRRMFRDAIRDRLMAYNPADGVRPPRHQAAPVVPWDGAEVRAFLAAVRGDRLHPVWRLSLLALRPEEVCGLRWESVDLAAGTLRVERARTLAGGRPVEKATKTVSSVRTLPLDADTVSALRELRKRQAAERLAAGPGYESGSHGGYVLADETGRPWDVRRLRKAFHRIVARAGLREIHLYNARHSCLSWLANEARVPISLVAAWAGHSNPAVTLAKYVKVKPADLNTARDALAELLA